MHRPRSVTVNLVLSTLAITVACGDSDPAPTPGAAPAGSDASVSGDGAAPIPPGQPPIDAGLDAPAEASSARSGLLAYEAFDYPAGPITGRGGGAGFAGPWGGNGRAFDSGGAGLAVSVAGRSLTAAGAAFDANGGTSSRPLDTKNLPPSLSDTPGKLGAAGGTVYLSFVMRTSRTLGDGEFAGVQLLDGTSEARFIGAPFYNAADPARSPHFGLDQPGLATPVYSGVPTTRASILCARLDFGLAGDAGAKQARVSLWVDPAVGPTPALGEPDVVLVGSDFRFDRIQTTGFAGAFIDELRIGETVASVLPGTGMATLIAYEPFDYVEGALFGRGGGLGWNGAWTSPNNTTSASTVVGAADLAGALLRGRASQRTQGGPPAQRLLDATAVPPGLSDVAGKIGAAGKALWVSFVTEAPLPGTDQFAGVQLFDGGFTDNELGLFIGAPYRSAGRPAEWGLDQPGLATPVYSGTPTTTRARIVVKSELPAVAGGSSTSAMWINPNATDEASLGVPQATLTGKDFRVDRVRIGGNYDGFLVDELRLGSTYADVAPKEVAP